MKKKDSQRDSRSSGRTGGPAGPAFLSAPARTRDSAILQPTHHHRANPPIPVTPVVVFLRIASHRLKAHPRVFSKRLGLTKSPPDLGIAVHCVHPRTRCPWSDEPMSLTNPPSSGPIAVPGKTVNLKRMQAADGNYTFLDWCFPSSTTCSGRASRF